MWCQNHNPYLVASLLLILLLVLLPVPLRRCNSFHDNFRKSGAINSTISTPASVTTTATATASSSTTATAFATATICYGNSTHCSYTLYSYGNYHGWGRYAYCNIYGNSRGYWISFSFEEKNLIVGGFGLNTLIIFEIIFSNANSALSTSVESSLRTSNSSWILV